MKKKKARKARKTREAAPPAMLPCEVCQKPLAPSHSIMPPSVHPECAYKGFFDAVQQAFWKYFPWVLLSAAVPIGPTLFARALGKQTAKAKKGRPKKKR